MNIVAKKIVIDFQENVEGMFPVYWWRSSDKMDNYPYTVIKNDCHREVELFLTSCGIKRHNCSAETWSASESSANDSIQPYKDLVVCRTVSCVLSLKKERVSIYN